LLRKDTEKIKSKNSSEGVKKTEMGGKRRVPEITRLLAKRIKRKGISRKFL